MANKINRMHITAITPGGTEHGRKSRAASILIARLLTRIWRGCEAAIHAEESSLNSRSMVLDLFDCNHDGIAFTPVQFFEIGMGTIIG